MTTDTSKPEQDEFAADDSAADAPTQTTQEAEDEQDQGIWDALDKQEETGEPLAADDSAAEDEPTQVVDPDPSDVWAGATDAQREAFDAAQKRGDSMEHAHKSEVGRTKTLRRQLSDVTVQLDRAAQTAPSKDDDAEGDDDDSKPNSWDELVSEYPEVAGPVNDRLSKIEDAQERQSREIELDEADAKEAHTQSVIEQTALLAEKHEDWLKVATTPEFQGWLDDQPRKLRDAAAVNAKEIVDATTAGDVITRYKASRSDPQDGDGPDDSQDTTDTSLAARRKRQLESGRSSRPKGPGTVVSGIPEEGSDEELWAGFDKLDAQEAAKA